MVTREYPTQEYLKQCLDYNPDTGVFTWKKRPIEHFKYEHGFKVWNAKYFGSVAGRTAKTRGGKNYSQIAIGKVLFYSHRLAWIYMHGSIADDMQIDHIDGNGDNNKLANLRVVDAPTNNTNKSIQSNNTSGCVGVSFLNREQKWRARINKRGKEYTIGMFANKCDAIKARKQAEIDLGFHANHGKRSGNNGEL